MSTVPDRQHPVNFSGPNPKPRSAAGDAFSGLVIVSCVPIGGHYLSDIVAGAAVWGAFVAITRLRPRVAHASTSAAARPAALEATPEQLATR